VTAGAGPGRQDLHTFLAEYPAEHPEDVLVVDEPVSPDQVDTALLDELERRGRRPLVRCTNVDGLGLEVITNVFASRERVARLLGAHERTLHEAFQRAAARPVAPVVVDGSPLETVAEGDDVSLDALPLLTHFKHDRAAYLTSGVFVAEDPATGIGNLSYHRSMAIGPAELSTSLHSRGHLWRALGAARDRGEPLAVAIVVGAHPLFMLAAAARVAADVDERDVAGGLFGEPLEAILTPRHGIAVPAYSEFVLEGTIDPDAHGEEGPFGEFSGYSSHRSTNNVVRVEALLRRPDAVLLDVSGGRSPDHLNLGRIPREAEMAQRLRERFPDVVAVHYPSSGTHFHAYVAVRPSMAGSARQVMLALLGWDPYLKTVVAVDDDVDMTSDSDVLWALATRFQPDQDTFIVSGLPGSLLDPSSSASGTTSRMALDATRGPGFDAVAVAFDEGALARARALLDGQATSG